MRKVVNSQGFVLHRIWSYRKQGRLAAGWAIKAGDELLMLCKRDGRWLISPCLQNWHYNEDGHYVHEPITRDDFPVSCTFIGQYFPTRREALQALGAVVALQQSDLYS